MVGTDPGRFVLVYGVDADSPDAAARTAERLGATHVVYGGVYTATARYVTTTWRVCDVSDLGRWVVQPLKDRGVDLVDA